MDSHQAAHALKQRPRTERAPETYPRASVPVSGRDFDLTLHDIDTPFPRSSSRTLKVYYTNGKTTRALTNSWDQEELEAWLTGKRVAQEYGPSHVNRWTLIWRIHRVELEALNTPPRT